MATDDPDFDAWVQRARDVRVEDVASIAGAKLKKTGGELVGPCPRCGGTDRFSVNIKDQVFNCRGAGGGDGIALAMHTQGVEFVPACEFILNEAPPRADRAAPARPIDDRIERERAEDRENEDRAKAKERAKADAEKAVNAQSIYDSGVPIPGTQADAYFRERGIIPAPEAIDGLRFIGALMYRGYADRDADSESNLGKFPCILAPMRDAEGCLIGLHRTYLDLRAPFKLKPPGDPARNGAKKMFGRKGLIRLGPIRPIMAVAEGIENALAWGQLGRTSADYTLAAAGDLGNMAGGWTDTIPHPLLARRSIPNGTPDPDRPGMAIPDEVKELILLGDGDSDPANTWAHILTALRRHRALGRAVSVDMAPAGKDWNDVLRDQLQAAREAA